MPAESGFPIVMSLVCRKQPLNLLTSYAQLTQLAQEVDAAQTGDSGLYFDENGKPHLTRLPGQTVSKITWNWRRFCMTGCPSAIYWTSYITSSIEFKYTDILAHRLVLIPNCKANPIIMMTVFGYGCNLGPRHKR